MSEDGGVRIDLWLQLVLTTALAVGAVFLVAHSHVVWGVIVGVLAIPLGQVAGIAVSLLGRTVKHE